MEDYKKIYPELLTKEPLKTATPSAFKNLAGFLRILKKKQNITQVSGKSTKDVTTYCREPAHYQELFRFVSAGLELEQHFLGLAPSRRITWRPWSYLWSL